MAENESSEKFIPYSSPMPIPGSSYSAQLGKIDERWTLRLVKGREILEMGYFDELNGNKMIAFIIQNLAIPMINPYQISQSVKALIKQAERGPLLRFPTSPAAETPSTTEASEYAALQVGSHLTQSPSTEFTGAPGGACPRCHRPIQSDFYFCPYCSQPLRKYLCQGCNREIRLDFSICPYCGLKT